MNENITLTELLIRYIDGELEGESLESIKNSIRLNPAVREEYDNLLSAKEAVNSFGLKKQIGALHTEMMQELKEEGIPRIMPARSILRRSLSIAATVLLALGFYTAYQYLFVTPERLFRENYQPFTIHETRGTNASALEEAYKKSDMEGVLKAFKNLSSPQTQDFFMAGNACLEIRQYPGAIESFTALQQSNKLHDTHFFEEDSEYYLALSYLGNGEPGKAVPIFEKIRSNKSHPYHKKVSAWLMARLHRLEQGK